MLHPQIQKQLHPLKFNSSIEKIEVDKLYRFLCPHEFSDERFIQMYSENSIYQFIIDASLEICYFCRRGYFDLDLLSDSTEIDEEELRYICYECSEEQKNEKER